MSGNLTHPVCDIIRQLLVDLGLGLIPAAGVAWPVYSAREPDSPDDCITVYSTQGRLEGRLGPTSEMQVHHGLQVRVRSSVLATGWAKAIAIAEALDKSVHNRGVVIESSQYVVCAVTRSSEVLPIGKEPESLRELFTINATSALWQTA